jgi:nucleoside-diphosphate-sugar epimerase
LGFIGSHLADSLLEKGYKVKCLVRKSSNLKWLNNKNVEYVYGDMFSKEVLYESLKDVDYVYHVAGVTFAKERRFLSR